MPLDAKLYREAREAYRLWNEAVLRERLHAVNKPSPQETWRQYVALTEFCWKIASPPSEQQRAQKMAALSQYYDRIHKLETWRQRHGKKA